MKLWTVSPLDKAKAADIQKKYELPPLMAMMLEIRKITSDDEIKDFLYNEDTLNSPFEIKDMDKAVKRIKKAVENDEFICVFGDYDADGVTSTTLLYSYLELIGANVMYYIPSREKEGYGMNKDAVQKLSKNGVKLIVTVDNGISAIDEIAYANELNIDTVVTDHHMPPAILPNACAIVDLHREDCNSKFKKISGVGVAFKLVCALEGENCDINAMLDNYSDLLCIGTVGDIVDLKGENRIFVRRGLQSIQNTDRIGIQSLLKASGLLGKKITAGRISFNIVPRINAVGRLGMSQKSVSLLLTENQNEADEVSKLLCDDNSERQQIEQNILQSIDTMIRENPKIVFDDVIVIDGENWHAGVIGIVAARIKDRYGKPTIIISSDKTMAKGSGRSVEGFSLCDAIFACSDLLTLCGGHPMAAGLTLKSENIEKFRIKINEYAQSLGKMPYDKLMIDCKLNPAGLSTELVHSLESLQPYGAGNPTPVFGLYNMTLVNIIPISNNKHLKLNFTRKGNNICAMKFFTSKEQFPYSQNDVLDLAVTLDINEYSGRENLSIIIKDIKPSDLDSEKIIESERIYQSVCLDKKTEKSEVISIMPTREDFALLYRYLKRNNGFNHKLEVLYHKLDNKLSFGKIRVIIRAMCELKLIEISEGIQNCEIKLLPVKSKVELDDADIIKKLKGVFD